MDRKKIAILGATGSIGSTALNIVRKYPHKFEVRLLVNAADKENLIKLVKEFKPQKAFCVNADFTYGFERNERASIDSPKLYQDIDLAINGIAGIAGLRPSIAVIQAGKTLATANKESFVAAGKLIDEERKKYSSKILPLDSEHSTVWQCVNGRTDNIKRIILTASGGAFRDYNYEELKQAKAVDALKHPNWVMGKKVTIDSATLMNKGMEIIEAKYFFGVSDIDVVMHRESIVHSLVELEDNFVIAGLSNPDMTQPIQYAMFYPQRIQTDIKRLDLAQVGSLNFGSIDEKLFPCLAIAKTAFSMGDIAGAVMNSADEVAVNAYLDNRIGFYDIPLIIEEAMDKFAEKGYFNNMEELFRIDKAVSEYTFKRIYGGN